MTRPWLAPVPVPPENAFRSPEVPPWAEAENASSPISIAQLPRPTGMPDSEASYWASSRPCADARLAPACQQAHAEAAAQQGRARQIGAENGH
jgi:hypothetical protein